MFIAILKRARNNGKVERFTAALRQIPESIGTDEPRWSDLFIDGGGQSYIVSKFQYKSQHSACKGIQKEFPKVSICKTQ